MIEVIEASETHRWRSALDAFARVDVCQIPEYHQVYSQRIPGSSPCMWTYAQGAHRFCYPFLLSAVTLRSADGKTVATSYRDISGIYGYSGPLSTSDDNGFLRAVWHAFDAWALQQGVISEFIRFSVYADNRRWASPACSIEANRPVSCASLPESPDAYMGMLDAKTRNMIRKALKQGLEARETDLATSLAEFRVLYDETMDRNLASGFFLYDDAYYQRLLAMPRDEIVLCGVYAEGKMVAAAMGLIHKGMALYHLGASTRSASQMGAGNLALFEMAKVLIARGVTYFNIGGGRTTAPDDPLFRFKKSCGTGVDVFHIGKRIVDAVGYADVCDKWKELNGCADIASPNLQFYR